MTTASSLTFNSMEAPVLDDTMEMASPYQGHADDFDIDLDVMEDQASNTDKDMIAAEDYPDILHDADFTQDGAKDSDMMDDIAEPAMIDADDQYQEVDQNVEMQYGTEELYEEEMLEDDYVQHTDASVPEIQEVEAFETTNQSNTREVGLTVETVTEDDSEKVAIEVHTETDAKDRRREDEELQNVVLEHDDGANESSDVKEPVTTEESSSNKTNEADQVTLQPVEHEDKETTTPSVQPLESEDGRGGPITQPLEEREKSVEEIAGGQTTEKPNVHEPERQIQHAPETTAHDSLHTVKVYYQENEISLFPPREGDSSETFFLENEALAFESLGKIFDSCREVLYEHIEENEILVFDIEALNIQIAEDSSHVGKVTLHQIIDVYLRLCHNDGIDTPEPLYLTLSTKMDISAEISDLLLAASQGKGLSEIRLWDEYQEVDDVPEEFQESYDQQDHAEEEELQKLHKDTTDGHDGQVHESQDVAEEVEPDHQVRGASSASHEQEAERGNPSVSVDREVRAASEATVPAGVTGVEDEAEEEGEVEEGEVEKEGEVEESEVEESEVEEGEVEEVGEVEETNDPEIANQELDPSHSLHEVSYDSEDPRTETTATMTHLPGADEHDAEDVGDFVIDDEPVEDDAIEQIEDEDYSEEEHDADYVDEGLNDHVDHPHDDDPTDSSFQGPRVEQPDHHAPSADNANDADEDYGDDFEETSVTDTGDIFHEDPGSVSNLQLPETQDRNIPDVADDTLDLATEPYQSPSHDGKIEAGNSTQVEEIYEDIEGTTQTNISQQNNEKLPLDDEEYIDLGLVDVPEVAGETPAADSNPFGSGSTKRPRELEDEFELAEASTPDLKRSRSS